MFKKILAIIMALLTILGLLSTLSGCSNNKNASISKGELLRLISEDFGMYSYTDTTPHTNTVQSENEFFPYVQTAYEWGVIDDKEIKVDEKSTKGFLAETLVKCVGFVDTDSMSQEEITDYAVKNKYVSFKYRGRTDNIRYVTLQEAEESIALAFSIWTNRKLEDKENLTIGENVCNLADGDVLSSQVVVNESEKTITIPEEAASEISEGTSFIVPANNVDTTAAAYKAEKIEYSDGYAIIKFDEAKLENTIQELEFSGCQKANLNNVPITDGIGNIINASAIDGMSSQIISPQATNLALTSSNSYSIMPCASMSLGFTVDGLSISGKINDNSISFSVKGDIPTEKKSGMKVTINKSFEISDISVDYDWNIEWFKIKSAYAKLNYTTKDTTGVSFSGKKEGALFYDQRTKPSISKILTSEVRSSSAAKGAKTITICSFPIVNGGVGRIDVDIKAKISVTGSVELVVTTHNSNGLEYKNGNIRYIKEKHNDVDLNVKAKIEATLYAGLSIKALRMNLLGVGFEGGIGVEFKAIAHLVNSDNVEIDKLSLESGNFEYIESSLNSIQNLTYDENGKTYTAHIDLCGEITTYGILKFKMDDDCALADILSGKTKKSGGVINLEIEILGSSNAKINSLCTHVENWKFVDECTRKYDGNSGGVSEKDLENNKSENQSSAGDSFDIDTYFLNLLVGNTSKITVVDLPHGYKTSDIMYTSSNDKIVTVDSNGKITAIAEGSAEITASIKGSDFKVKCSVVVSAVNENTFNGIKIPHI
mgnify:CR=1 FL=1